MRRGQGGFTYLYLLFAVAVLSVALLGEASVRHYDARRQAETELLRIGREFRDALASYRSSGDGRELPVSLEDLLDDGRSGGVRRHLRRIPYDPVTRTREWGLIQQGGRIVGVHSLSPREPLKVAGFDPEEEHFEGARHYHEWRFMILPEDPAVMSGTAQSPGQRVSTIGP